MFLFISLLKFYVQQYNSREASEYDAATWGCAVSKTLHCRVIA